MTAATLRPVLLVALVVLAGCSGTAPGDLAGPSSATTADADDGTVTADDDSPAGRADAGTVRFYISDEPNAIGDFAHLNVTVSAIGFHRVDGAGGDDGDDDESGENGTTTAPNATTSVTTTAATGSANNTTTTGAANTTTRAGGIVTTTPDDGDGSDEGDDDGEAGGGEDSDGDGEDDDTDAGDGSGGGEWVTYEVSNVTVDLTRLVGANATRVVDLAVPAGSYDAVFIYVEDVDATLTTGEEVRVKLPSGKLQLHTRFAVGANESVEFVYDVAVHEAGKSGKYVLRPVVSESGTDVPIAEVGGDGEDEEREDEAAERGDTGDDGAERDGEHGKDGGEGADREDERLNVTLVGTAAPGGNVTVQVTRNGSVVAGAEVEVNGERVGKTGADGRVRFAVPDADELDVEVKKGGVEAELTVEFDAAGDGGRDGSDGNES